MAKHIAVLDFPRTVWKENLGFRKVLAKAFNNARSREQYLLAMQTHLRFMTNKVNAALLELETGKPVAVAPEVTAPVDSVVIPPALDIPILVDVSQ